MIKEPQIHWPEGLEVYESKSEVQSNKQHQGQKIFEYLLIARRPGTLEIPQIEFYFFNPDTETYELKKIQKTTLSVTGSENLNDQKKRHSSQPDSASVSTQSSFQWSEIIPPTYFGLNWSFTFFWKIIWGINGGIFLLWISWIIWDRFQKMQLKTQRKRAFHGALKKWLKTEIEDMSILIQAYMELEEKWIEWLEERFHFSFQGLTRAELQKVLMKEKKMSESEWKNFHEFLEKIDRIRFDSQKNLIMKEKDHQEFKQWLKRLKQSS